MTVTYFAGSLILVELLFCTKNRDPRSAFRSIETFCKILWQSDRTSKSLQISLTCFRKDFLKTLIFFNNKVSFTNSNMSSFSSNCFNSLRDSR